MILGALFSSHSDRGEKSDDGIFVTADVCSLETRGQIFDKQDSRSPGREACSLTNARYILSDGMAYRRNGTQHGGNALAHKIPTESSSRIRWMVFNGLIMA